MQFKLAVYDPIFKRRIIEVKVGLCHKIRLATDGYVLAYMTHEGDAIYIVKCRKCKHHFLAKSHGWRIPEFECLFCSRIEMIRKVHGLP